MKKLIISRLQIIVIYLTIFTGSAFSQIDNVDFLRAGAEDGLKILEAYLTPMANAFGAGLNGSWYNTAKPHKLGGFDITISGNVGMIPESAGTFNVGDLGLTTLTGSGTSPTISGPKTAGPTLTKTVNGVTLSTFQLPPGTDVRFAPVPTANIGLGLPFGTEVKVRYIPVLAINESDLSLWGVGLMHSIVQYIPKFKLLPVDISVFGGYTKLQGHVPLNLQVPFPLPSGTTQSYVIYNPSSSFLDQRVAATAQAWNASVIGSLNLRIITVYGGLGYSKTQTEMVLEGNYPTPLLVSTPAPPHPDYNDTGVLSGSEIHPINIVNLSGIRANAGVRFKFAVFTIHLDYTRSLYNVYSAGLGISFR